MGPYWMLLALLGLGAGCLSVPPPAGDADGPAGDAMTTGCPPGCTSCRDDLRVCLVDCAGDACSAGVVMDCPPGWDCQIDCRGPTACRGGEVRCTGSCAIRCEGAAACEAGLVSCAGPRCAVACVGKDACDKGIWCDAEACDITCDGSAACEDGGGPCCNNADCAEACHSLNGGNCTCSPH